MEEPKIIHDKIEIKDELMNVAMFSEFLRQGLEGYELDRGIKVTLSIEWTDKKVTMEENETQEKTE